MRGCAILGDGGKGATIARALVQTLVVVVAPDCVDLTEHSHKMYRISLLTAPEPATQSVFQTVA